jgi:hypothetical protein
MHGLQWDYSFPRSPHGNHIWGNRRGQSHPSAMEGSHPGGTALTVTLHFSKTFFFSAGFYSPLRTLAFLNGLLDPQTFGRTPWLGDQSNARPLPKHGTTQHRNTQTHIHAPSSIRTCDLNVQVVVHSTCLRPLDY